MLAYIKGTVAAVDSATAVIECNNIGYEISASARCLEALTVGAEVKMFTQMIVREDSLTLFGFRDGLEKDMFNRLITVSGVGPKLALAVLGGIDARTLVGYIASQNVTALNAVKGVGKKTAERILLDLKDKIKEEASGILPTGDAATVKVSDGDDCVLALMALGYSCSEAVSAISRVADRDKKSTEQIVFEALRG